MQVSSEAVREIKAALARYLKDVENSDLTPSTKRTYMRHAETFVRWIEGDFVPGGSFGTGADR
ncbi:MAG: hypothetical protein M0Z94_01720 [Dehalococcoidales bacterium]|nr:hypothetical protein [Dehalococcoidales bacterium]